MESLHEEWRAVAGQFDGWSYEVSNFGRVRGTSTYRPSKNGIRVQHISNAGYWILALHHQNKLKNANAHILVAEAFHGVRQSGMYVNHKDGNKKNNRADNLEWVTAKDNMKHAAETGLWNPHHRKGKPLPHFRGEGNPRCTITEADVLGMRKLWRTGAMTLREIGKLFGKRYESIHKVVSYQRWKHVA